MLSSRTRYATEIEVAAARYGLDSALVEAVVLQESAGKTSAYRYEPAFWERYMATNSLYKAMNPERASASYGLMQVMFAVAVELGFSRMDPPEKLFVPETGLNYGCRKLAELMAWAHGDRRAALAAFNGGRAGNKPGGELRNGAYADAVLRRVIA